MNMNEANQLTRIYNTLLLIKTSGEDTVTMGRCLETFKTFLTQTPIYDENINNNLKEEGE
jgi:hypothetical protein